MFVTFKLFIFTSVLFSFTTGFTKPPLESSEEEHLHPVILVPGLGGSRLNAKIRNKLHTPEPFCDRNSEEFAIWLDAEMLLELWKSSENTLGKCWVDNMRLEYNNVTRTTSDVQGVEISVPGFGDTKTVEKLYPDDNLFDIIVGIYDTFHTIHSYEPFKTMSNALQNMGLKPNISIRGAPYDFRKAPNEHQEYFVKLKNLVEETYYGNENTPVVLIAHSMGGPMTLHFLHQQSQEWKDKFIKSLVSLSAAWGGSLKAFKAYTDGKVFGGFEQFSSFNMDKVLSTMPSVAWMLPSRQFWNENDVLVSTWDREYTLNDMEQFFNDLGKPTAWEMYKNILYYTLDPRPPGVEVHCLYGTGVKTLKRLQFDSKLLAVNPKSINGDGDGTVNLRSLKACTQWDGSQKEKVHHKGFEGVNHMHMLWDDSVIDYVSSVVRGEL